MNAVIYARYSSHNQREESIEGQLRECQNFAEKQGYNVIGRYIDRAISARTDRRPEFQRMITDSAKKQFSVVLVWKGDRFARNRYDSVYYKRQLLQNGVVVVSTLEPTTNGPEKIILESLLEGMDEYYSVELALKVRRGLTENALKCKYNGGTMPFGYYADENQHFQIDPVTAPIVREIFERYAEGETIRSIQRSMNERGITTQQGKPFSPNSFSVMLKNRRYLGEYRYGNTVTPGGMPQIISESLFEMVQQRLARNQRAPASAKATEPYLLTGKLFCGLCGKAMAGESGRSHTGIKHYYYKCSAAKCKQGCRKKAIRKQLIEDLVVNQMIHLLWNDTMIERIADLAVKEIDKDSVLLPKLYTQQADIHKRLANLLKAIEAGIFNDTTQRRMTELEQQQEKLENEIAKEKLKKPSISREDLIAWLLRFCDLDMKKENHRRILIDSFLNAVYVYDDKITLIFNYKEGTETISLSQVEGSDLSRCAPPVKAVTKVTAFLCLHIKSAGKPTLFTDFLFLPAQKPVQKLTPARLGRRRMRGLLTGLLDGLLHQQHLRTDGVGHGRFFAVGAVRLQHTRLHSVMLHGIQNVVQPCAHFGRVDGTGNLNAALGVAGHHIG